MLYQACAVVRHSLEPQVVQELSRVGDCGSRNGGHESQPAKADSRFAEDSQALPSTRRCRPKDEEIEEVKRYELPCNPTSVDCRRHSRCPDNSARDGRSDPGAPLLRFQAAANQ